ncbi:unnamed protein product [Hymenolepis diminuta]|uniref:DUF148 domain-containing protein n=1 Tax=Hymenolepis diminuta TaxID=6216 RepID=A0A0R3SSG7_HYMDI|nr:unnamed protein product [Hymenolepis diminuta]VUZ52173.1 unnamed protein product [Hymenolepis diminuta]
MASLNVFILLAVCLVRASADPSVVQHNHGQIQAALETDISPKDLQKIIASMEHLDETLRTLDPTTIEAIAERSHNPDKLFLKLSPETIEEILAKTRSVVAQKLPRTKRKMIDSWFDDIDNDNHKQKRQFPENEGYYHPYSFGYYFCPFEYPCEEFGCEPVPEVYQPFGDGHFPGSEFDQYYYPEYHPVDSLEPSVRHSILKYMPNIPGELADALFYLEPGFVSYIINHHKNLQDFMTKMDPLTVQFIMSYVRELPSLVAKMEPKAIETIFSGVEHVCDYLSHFQDQYPIKIIVGKVPLLHTCIPHIVPEKSTSTTTTTTTTTQAPTTTEEVVKYPPFYTKEDIDKASLIIPKIGELLDLLEREKLEAIHDLIPSISDTLNELSQEQIDFINEKMDNIIDLVKNMDEKMLQQIKELADDDPLLEFVMEFF